MQISFTGLATVLALHAAVFWGLLQMKIIQWPVALPVLSVDLLTPPAPETPQPKIVPPKHRPVEKRPVERPVQIATQLAIPAEAPVSAPAIDVLLAAVPPAPTFTTPAPYSPAASPVPSAPRFDADYLDNPKPHYPALSRRLGEAGRVVLRVQVAANGLPTEITLHSSSGFERLDNAAKDTVRRWRFVPARLGSEPVAASVLVPIIFSLKD